MEQTRNRVEAERLLRIGEKLLENRDLHGSRDFAILAQENDALLEGVDQMLAVVDVLRASEKRINNHHDWYTILQVDHKSHDHEFIEKQYRKLTLLLHPDKNRFTFADIAFNLVTDAWTVLSDQNKKSLYDKELTFFSHVNLNLPDPNRSGILAARKGASACRKQQRHRVQQRKNSRRTYVKEEERSTFWTACPYCLLLFEYHSVYEGCSLRCQNCKRCFQGVMIPNVPRVGSDQDTYYYGWCFFPLGLMSDKSEKGGEAAAGKSQQAFPNWIAPVLPWSRGKSKSNEQQNLRHAIGEEASPTVQSIRSVCGGKRETEEGMDT